MEKSINSQAQANFVILFIDFPDKEEFNQPQFRRLSAHSFYRTRKLIRLKPHNHYYVVVHYSIGAEMSLKMDGLELKMDILLQFDSLLSPNTINISLNITTKQCTVYSVHHIANSNSHD